MNPFHHRGPVTDAAHFFGRAREMDMLLSRTAGAAKPQCVSVVAPRRMGKSSLLRQVADVHGPARPCTDGPIVFAYESLEGAGSLSVERFFASLIRRLGRRIQKLDAAFPVPAAAAGDSEQVFGEWVEELSEAGLRIVLLLDEFDVVTMNPAFDAGIFGRLRYLTGSFQLAWVTASFAPLADLCHREEVRQSPFFNVFSTLQLGLLTEAEAGDLLSVESAGGGRPFAPEELQLVRELAGTHPFHLQQAGTALWEAEVPADPEAVRAAFLEEAVPHFRYAVEHLPPRERTLLGTLAAGHAAGPEEAGEVASLMRRGIIVREGEALRLFSAGFATWFARQHGVTSRPVVVSRAAARPTGDTSARPDRRDETGTLDIALRSPAAGSILDERYALKRELARGGFGIVFEAEDLVLRRQVAVKILRPERQRGEDARSGRERMLQEARAAARVTHPNVVTLHDVKLLHDDIYVVMELLSGRSLKDLLDERGALDRTDALDLLAQAADGVAAAHELGIVHRDIKPDNLVVDDRRRVKVVDFGLALIGAQARLTPASRAVLTPRYCAPEQVTGGAIGPTADVFSLACVLHEALTGWPPFDGETISEVLFQLVSGTPPPHLSQEESLRGGPAALLERCLAREPGDRPPDAAAFAREVRALMPGGAELQRS